MNREERRAYFKECRKDPMAKYCPVCRHKTKHFARPTKNHLCDIVCECCCSILAKDSNTAVPMTYV